MKLACCQIGFNQVSFLKNPLAMSDNVTAAVVRQRKVNPTKPDKKVESETEEIRAPAPSPIADTSPKASFNYDNVLPLSMLVA